MADDLPPSQSQPQPQPQFQDSDADISSLLHTLLHNSSSQPAAPAPASQFPGSAPFSDSPAFVDPSFPFSHSAHSFDDPDFHSEEEARLKSSAPGRSSSKRCRAAEVHNLSEKRRRQRINEKIKAPQKLIPNSNKTDKASMLDEAIEYLKQLQLQVQMLTMRNYSSSSHPFYLPGALQSSSSAALLNEGNSCRIGSFTADQEASVGAMFNLSSRPSDFMTRMSEDNSSGQALVPEPSMTRQYRSFNASIPSKVRCKDLTLPPLRLDMSHCGQSSSSGVSS